MNDPDDTLPPSGHDTIPAPPVLDDPSHEPFAIGYPIRPVTFFPSVLQVDDGVIALDSSDLDD